MPFSVYFSFASKSSHNNHKENIFQKRKTNKPKQKLAGAELMKFRYLKIGVPLKHYLKKLKYCFRFLKRDLEIPKTTTALNFVSNFSNEICITITPLKCLRPSYTAYIKLFYFKSSRKITPC